MIDTSDVRVGATSALAWAQDVNWLAVLTGVLLILQITDKIRVIAGWSWPWSRKGD